VDDSFHVRDALRMCLSEMAEIEVCGEAVDGLDAVEKAMVLVPDLVLLDLAMPEMNGVEVSSVLKKHMPKMRVILFTMYEESIGKSLTSAVGVDIVLSKPNGLSQILTSVKTLLAF
jgi:two-component system vancomycin resistance associated response regulator VraR